MVIIRHSLWLFMIVIWFIEGGEAFHGNFIMWPCYHCFSNLSWLILLLFPFFSSGSKRLKCTSCPARSNLLARYCGSDFGKSRSSDNLEISPEWTSRSWDRHVYVWFKVKLSIILLSWHSHNHASKLFFRAQSRHRVSCYRRHLCLSTYFISEGLILL